jgi:hypothetical protein
MNKLERYAEKAARIFWILNHRSVSNENILDLISDMNIGFDEINATTALLLGGNLIDLDIAIHDCYTRDFTQRRDYANNGYHTKFYVQADIFQSHYWTGQLNLGFEIKSKQKFRNLNQVELYDFKIDQSNKQVLFMFHRAGDLRSLIIDYLEFSVKPFP